MGPSLDIKIYVCDLVTGLTNICDTLQIENRSLEVLYVSLEPILYTRNKKATNQREYSRPHVFPSVS